MKKCCYYKNKKLKHKENIKIATLTENTKCNLILAAENFVKQFTTVFLTVTVQ